MWEAGIGIGITGTSFVLAYISMEFDEKHWPMKWFFLACSIIFMILSLAVGQQLATDNSATTISNLLSYGFKAMITILGVALFYLMIRMIWTSLKVMADKKRQEDEDI